MDAPLTYRDALFLTVLGVAANSNTIASCVVWFGAAAWLAWDAHRITRRRG